jgi:hypothetical protein
VPTLIWWIAGDQPDWGAQIRRLKVGTSRRFTFTIRETLVADLRSILAPQCAAGASEIAKHMTDPAESVARTAPVYLAIGVSKGVAFRQIAADEKIAVDPAFMILERSRRIADAKARTTHYFETTSDDFFAGESEVLARRGVDVALIDGLHTYRQVARDVENTLKYLRDDGVILLHDCNPAHATIECAATSYADFRVQNPWWVTLLGWSGDVWKAIVYLRSSRHDLRIAVLDCDCGVGVIRRGAPEAPLSYTPEEIDGFGYADLAGAREHLLNLRAPAHLKKFLG